MKNPRPKHILVVDDHFIVRMGLSASRNVEPDMQVVGEGARATRPLPNFASIGPTSSSWRFACPG